jgi:hypothetical protein
MKNVITESFEINIASPRPRYILLVERTVFGKLVRHHSAGWILVAT